MFFLQLFKNIQVPVTFKLKHNKSLIKKTLNTASKLWIGFTISIYYK